MTRETLEELVEAHQAEIYRYLRYLGADAATASDLAQDTFLSAFQGPEGGDLERVPGRCAWLRGIARHRFLMYCRRRRTSPVQVSIEDLEDAEAFWSTEFLRDGDGFEYLEALGTCVEDLTDREREAVALQYRERKSRSELARLLKLSEDGIKSMLRRIRASLASCVKGKLGLEDA